MSFVASSARRLAVPKVVSFDAFGTLYTPREPVSLQYFNIAKKYIEGLSEVKESSVINAIVEARSRFPNYGKSMKLTQEQWWSDVIKKIFVGKKYDQKMIEEIYDHFVDKDAYHVYADVKPILQNLQKHNVKLVICSNSDERLRQIITSLELKEFFQDDDIFLSYDLDCSKPDAKFFDKVADILSAKLQIDKTVLVNTNNWWHCGDEYRKDYQFAIENGIRGIYVDRDFVSQSHDNNNYMFEGDNLIVKDLDVLSQFI